MENIIPPTTPEKKCSQCKEIKPLSEFYKDAGRPDGLFMWCKVCACNHSKTRYDAGLRKVYPDRMWNKHILRTYGITAERYEEMLTAQNGVCAICGQPETSITRSGVLRKLSVDHDHTTGRVRALLCQGCNMALGHLNEDPVRAQRLLDYIKLKKLEE